MMKNNPKFKSFISLILTLCMLVTLTPSVYAAQSNEYVDPADSWLSANNRTNELDVNATITNETQFCCVCRKDTSVLAYRVPEYTKTGGTALNRDVKYSDGTCLDGFSKGNLDSGTPGVDAYYTGYHYTKSVCQTCGTINPSEGSESYAFNNNIYILNSCAHNFFLDFDSSTYERYDEDYHLTTLKRGEYCKFCKGTFARATKGLEEHNFIEKVDAQIGNNRFFIAETCDTCGYESSEYVTAKSVVTSYYGIDDGEAHTLSVSDLSDRGVKTSVRYGTTADSCTRTSAPNYTNPGYYTVYYEIDYTYAGETMTENGVSYIWIVAENEDEDDKSGTIVVLPQTHEHEFHYLETIKPSCVELGYERFQCSGCGELEKRNYTPALGHDYDNIVIKEPTCKQGGLVLTLCADCGDFYQTTTSVGEHKYKLEKHNPTCKNIGYTDHICEICEYSYITDITPIISHSYERITKEPTCVDKGYTTSTCTMCGYGYVDNYTDEIGHDWDEGHTVTNSTCDGEGVIEYICKSCDEKMIKATSAKGHRAGADATCTEPQICKDCGTVLKKPNGHSYTSKVTNPTCTSMGFTTYTCVKCNDSYTDDYTDKAKHKYNAKITVPTCTSHGYTTYSCSDCDEEYVSDYVEKSKHNYKSVVTAPSCTAMGYTTFTCRNCSDSYVGNYTDMTEHNYNKETIEPTCTEHGYAIYTCPDCNKSYIGDYTENTEHIYTETVVAPTCTEMGYSIFKCNDCEDEYKGNYTDKLAHDYSKEVTKATCTSLGYTTYTCQCGDTYKADYAEPTGHLPSDWIVDVPATIENGGTKHIECTVCKVTMQISKLPQLIGKDNSNEDGKAQIGDYTIILTDENGNPIFNAELSIDVNDNVSIKLTNGRLLDFAKPTTITAYYTETKEAKENLKIFIEDANGNKTTGATNGNGQLVVPNSETNTGDDNGTIGKEDGDKKETFVVTVTDKTNALIPNCDIYIGESNNIVVDLPEGIKPTRENPVIVTITDHNGKAQKDVTVIALGEADYIEKGKTDIYGKLTLPTASDGYTDENGKVNVDELNVIVSDSVGFIENAYVMHTEDKIITVTLPEDKTVGYKNRITVTVLDSVGNPITDKCIEVRDNFDNAFIGYTDKSGKVTLPYINKDYTDGKGNAEVSGYILSVTRESGAIEKAFVTYNAEVLNEDKTIKSPANISVLLPGNVFFDYADRITVKVIKKADGSAVKGMTIYVSETIKDSDNKTLNGLTDNNGTIVFPPLSEDITDKDGNSGIEETTPGEGEDAEDKTVKYTVAVADTKGDINNAFIKIEDGKVHITLPETHTLTTSNQTTATITNENGEPVKGVSVTITDKTTSKSGTTDSNGKVTLPVKSSGGSSRPSSSGGGGGSSYSSTSVKITDKDGKSVSVSRSNGTNISTLTLPAGKNLLKDDNYYNITVTSSSKPKKGYVIVLKDRNGNEVRGTTDEDGKLVLPSSNHNAYIFGYDDGTFRPDSNMSRSEAAAIFARLISEEKGEAIVGRSTFKDVASKDWHSKYVAYLEKYDIIKGYEDKTFKPNEPVTRAEFVTMAVRYYSLFNEVKKSDYTVAYTDLTKSYWAYADIAYAKHIDWLNGYADGTFKGDNNITRAEVVTVVNRATGRIADEEYISKNTSVLNKFTDLKQSHWSYPDVMEAANDHTGVKIKDGEAWVK